MSSRINYGKLSYWSYSNRHHMTSNPEYDDPYTVEKRIERFDKLVNEQNESKEQKKKNTGISKKANNNQMAAKSRKANKIRRSQFRNGIEIVYVLDISRLNQREKDVCLHNKNTFDICVLRKIKEECNVHSPQFFLCDDNKIYVANSVISVFRTKVHFKYKLFNIKRIKEYRYLFENYNIIQKGICNREIPFVIAVSKDEKVSNDINQLIDNFH